jgi:hypothetical protein
MSISEIKTKAIPYYACYIAQKLAAVASTTTIALREASWFDGDDEDGPRYLLDDYEIVSAALKFLEARDILLFVEDEFGPDIVARKSTFNDALRILHSEQGTVFNKFDLAGDGRSRWLRLALISVNDRLVTSPVETIEYPNAPEADEWSPIPLDRDDPDQRVAVEALEQVAEDLRRDNGYAATNPEEKAYVQDKLLAVTKRLKDESQISWMYLSEFAFKPLGIIIKRFGGAAIGIAAITAKEALTSWLKTRGLNFLDDMFK